MGRYLSLAFAGFLALGTTCHNAEISDQPITAVQESHTYFSDFLSGEGDRFLNTVRSRLLEYQEDLDLSVREKDELGQSYFPIFGGGKIRRVNITRDRIRFENTGKIKQDVPGYKDQLVIRASPTLEFRYRIVGKYLVLDRTEGKMWTEFADGIPRPLGLFAIAAATGMDIDPEIDINKIAIGEFEGREAAMILNTRTKRYCLLDLRRMSFIETQKSYEQLVEQIKSSAD